MRQEAPARRARRPPSSRLLGTSVISRDGRDGEVAARPFGLSGRDCVSTRRLRQPAALGWPRRRQSTSTPPASFPAQRTRRPGPRSSWISINSRVEPRGDVSQAPGAGTRCGDVDPGAEQHPLHGCPRRPGTALLARLRLRSEHVALCRARVRGVWGAFIRFSLVGAGQDLALARSSESVLIYRRT